MILFIVGFVLLFYGVSEVGSDGWGDLIVLFIVIVGIIVIVVFVI